ncbi:sugar phosphate isomerase/epimerase family protein [Qingshengfaniella alkalisoli]|uniref:Sugar phosphate isomerase/epimerase n=1 Tax=Qingshengfaniella alkalisoli TaxID=2599296 RepID=A0A5B8IUV0_9RHOB|nr:TIM barrel protein [Qingshengfaniella alkalisoli]QDY69213.1 sugar phosphate isomerase/epimerase [Qingshengfaniella alkalisoli]
MNQRVTISPGLCSVTFRHLSPDEIIALCADTGIEAIEWGMDLHLPPGDIAHARKIGRRCAGAGIALPTVGSYVRCEDNNPDELKPVLESANAVGARSVRIWAGTAGSAEISAEHRARTIDTIRDYCDLAQDAGLVLSLEYHGNTLTDTLQSTLDTLATVNHPALTSYWQPRKAGPIEKAMIEVESLHEYLSHIHCFHWESYQNRYALSDGRNYWKTLFTHLANIAMAGPDETRWAFLEFVRGDDPDQFREDAATLIALLEEVNVSG